MHHVRERVYWLPMGQHHKVHESVAREGRTARFGEGTALPIQTADPCMTFNELCERLKDVEETQLLEMLEINSDAIVNRFHDHIEKKRDYLEEDLEVDDVFDNDGWIADE